MYDQVHKRQHIDSKRWNFERMNFGRSKVFSWLVSALFLSNGLMQKILLTSEFQDLYGDGVDCQDEYVEILDGDSVDALSLGK